jgi:hypothetical protein
MRSDACVSCPRLFTWDTQNPLRQSSSHGKPQGTAAKNGVHMNGVHMSTKRAPQPLTTVRSL